MRSLGIRAATVLDAGRLAHVHGTSMRESCRGLLPEELIDAEEERGREFYPKALAEPDAASYWVAEWDGEVVGFVAAEALGPGQVRLLELTSLYVLEEFQGRGIGDKLLNHAIGSAPCLLWVLDGSPAADYFRRRGFDFDGTRQTREALGGTAVRRMVR